MSDDGIKVTTQMCALMMDCTQDQCTVCGDAGCTECPNIRTGSIKGCPIPKCLSMSCPRKTKS